MPEPAIRVDNVWKKFRVGEFHDSLRDLIPDLCMRALGRGPKRDQITSHEFWALKDLSFEVQQGESLGIIGPNGAGKTTLLKLLTKIIRPNRGTYHVNGRVSALISVGAGFHGDLTGRENIYLNGAILGMKRREIRAREEEIIDFADVRPFIDTPVKRYSSGMGARLGFAVAAHLRPEVLLVDEVLSVGDARFRQKCISHMHKLIRSDVTVVFISHILDQVRALCPNTIVLDKGEIVYHGATDGALKKYMDVLAEAAPDEEPGDKADAELRNIRFCDENGTEVLEWGARHPALIEFDLVIHSPLEGPYVKIQFSTIGGTWMGGANSRDYLQLPTQPGCYTARFTLDPIPFLNGDFEVQLQLCSMDPRKKIVWLMRQPRVISIRDTVSGATGVRCEGEWSMCPRQPMLSTPHLSEVSPA